VEDKENPMKRKQSDDFDPPGGTMRRRKSKVKGADTGSIYGYVSFLAMKMKDH
jgi:hypothetical protein